MSLVVIHALEKNRSALEKILFAYYPKHTPHNVEISGGGERGVATLFFSGDTQ